MPPGPQGLKALAGAIQAAFSDGRSAIDDIVAEGDRVAWRWTYRARHTGDFQGIPASGKEVALTGITIDRIVDGKFVERWSVTDNLGFLQQLGAIPAATADGAQTG
jgi:predicted ester cyclase